MSISDIVAFANCCIPMSGYFGLIFMKEPTFLLLNPHKTMVKDALHRLSILARTISAQWFGNHVTLSWWSSVWLSSALASFNKYAALKRLDPYWNAVCSRFYQEGLEVLYDVHEAMYQDSLGSRYSLLDKSGVDDNSEHPLANGNVRKGMCLIRMLEGFLQKENLRRGLSSFLQNYKREYINEDAVWKAIEKTDQNSLGLLSVTSVMNTWTKQAGYPIVTVQRFYTSRSAKISQSRYYLTEPREESRLRAQIAISQDPNATSKCSVLRSSGLGQTSLALSACRYLTKETEYLPWKTVLNAWRNIERLLTSTAVFTSWRAFVIRLITPIYTALNWEEMPSDNVLRTQHHNTCAREAAGCGSYLADRTRRLGERAMVI
ncbi:aminopeptidase Ey-like [Ixodes scapularis]